MEDSIQENLNIGKILYSKGDYETVIKMFKYLLYNVPDDRKEKAEILRIFANSYYHLKDFESAIPLYENYLNFCDYNDSVYNMLGYLYFYRNIDKSIKYYLKGMALKPDLANYVMLTQVMIKSADYKQKDLKETFEKYVDIFRPLILKGAKPYTHEHIKKDPDKRLKIGYLSSDFHCHAMMQFVLPILENHNKDKFDFFLYSCGQKRDYVTERIKSTGMTFKDCKDLDNEQLAELINQDNIDILIDISGYTHKAIWSLLYKPAPIIVQYLGFLGTYGIKEVDYIITDDFTIPEDIAPFYTEKPMYIPCGMNRFTFNTINQKLPEILPLPYDENGYITFGSFNCTSKINPYTVSLWSKVLKAVPSSKLLIYRTQMKDVDIERYKKQFRENGVDLNRIIFDNTPTTPNHFTSYNKCDVSLDPHPFGGLTLTIEQAHMGVPVLTLMGETISSRGTSRVNKSIGLNEFIAKTEDEFVENAVKISSDVEKLRYYRNNLREIVKNSDLCNDFSTFAQQIEVAYVRAWQDYCTKV